ncbi:MAG: ABC transporter ATP-binding protein [Planctomycetaceae bacterium]|nr:ABC transporter ATP-binding protein [Planctomycetaceae bacterium]
MAGSSTTSSSRLLLRLLRITLEYRRPALVVVFLQTLLVVLGLSTLGLTGMGIDFLRSTVAGSRPDSLQLSGMRIPVPEGWSPLQVIVALSLSILVVAAVTAWLKYLSAMASASLSQLILIRMRTAIYDKLQRLSFHFYDAGESSSIINRAAGDANAVRNFMDGVVIKVLTVSLTLAVYLYYMVCVHPRLTLVCLAGTPLLWIGAAVFSRVVQPAYRRAGELGDVMIRTLVENLQGIHVVKGFAREDDQADRFRIANENIRQQKESIFFKVSVFQPAMGLLTQINMLILIGYGGNLVIRGELALGTGLFVFANLLQEFANQVGQITNIVNSIQTSLTSAERVFEVLDAPIRITSSPDAVRLPHPCGHITLKNVSFGYVPDTPVLQDVSLEVQPGECIGITGPTGSGKTTLLSLLMRFYDADSGCVLLDSMDVRELDIDDVRRCMGIVFQDSFLFSNTVAANIAFGDPTADIDRVHRAAELASADEFIREMPEGYHSMVGEHGSNLSGGQRQRLALARAMLGNPTVLLLDDATASVDPETEHEIREAMLTAVRGRTTIIVSNRLSTLQRTDRIIVLENGRISAKGTHDELLNQCEYYRRLHELQFADSP